MIIFLNEDRAYRSWVTHHRKGFVLDGRHKPKFSRLMLHRADCQLIKAPVSSRSGWTTGSKFKACALDSGELETWAAAQSAKPPECCPACQPAGPRDSEPVHLTRLGREILDYVLDATVIHLEHEHPPYRLTISDIAACFAKTPGQLGPVLHSLLEQQLVAIPGGLPAQGAINPKRLVLPTIATLRLLDSFRDEPDEALAQELARLHIE